MKHELEIDFKKFLKVPFPKNNSDNDIIEDIHFDLVLYDDFVAGLIDKLIRNHKLELKDLEYDLKLKEKIEALLLESGWHKYTYGGNFWYGQANGVYVGQKVNTIPKSLIKAQNYAKAGKFVGRFGGPAFAAVNFKLLSDDFEAGKISMFNYNKERLATAIGAIPYYGTVFAVGREVLKTTLQGAILGYKSLTKPEPLHSGKCEVCPFFK